MLLISMKVEYVGTKPMPMPKINPPMTLTRENLRTAAVHSSETNDMSSSSILQKTREREKRRCCGAQIEKQKVEGDSLVDAEEAIAQRSKDEQRIEDKKQATN